MRAGQLRHRIEIQRQAGTDQNDHGEYQPEDWRTVFTRWGAVEPISARESEFAKGFAATVSHRVRIRHTDDVEPHHRVRHDGRNFAINGIVNVDERGRETHLYCTETA